MTDRAPVVQRRWVLLHGTPLSPAIWDEVAALLRRHGDVVIPSVNPPVTAAGTNAQQTLAAEILETLPLDHGAWHIVGHSFGGQVGLEMALAAAGRFRSLTVICSRDTPFPAFAPVAASLREGGPIDVDAVLERWFRPGDFMTHRDTVAYARSCLASADRGSWAAALTAISDYDRSGDVSRIVIPVTLLAAEFDQVSPPAAMTMLAHRLPDAVFRVQPDAAHMTPFLDPTALAGLILDAAQRDRTLEPQPRGLA